MSAEHTIAVDHYFCNDSQEEPDEDTLFTSNSSRLPRICSLAKLPFVNLSVAAAPPSELNEGFSKLPFRANLKVVERSNSVRESS